MLLFFKVTVNNTIIKVNYDNWIKTFNYLNNYTNYLCLQLYVNTSVHVLCKSILSMTVGSRFNGTLGFP